VLYRVLAWFFAAITHWPSSGWFWIWAKLVGTTRNEKRKGQALRRTFVGLKKKQDIESTIWTATLDGTLRMRVGTRVCT